jgi:(2Fe-2S) ferredoxin
MPGFTRHVFVCLNERPADDPRGCCSSRGGTAVFAALKVAAARAGLQGVRINRAGCLDHCSRGPAVVVYPEATWYRVTSAADADEIVREHIAGGTVVDRLLMNPTMKHPPTEPQEGVTA